VPRWGRRFLQEPDDDETEPPSPGGAWDDGYNIVDQHEDLPAQQGPQPDPLAAWAAGEHEPQGLERLAGQWQDLNDQPWDEWFIEALREQVTSGYFDEDPRHNGLAQALAETYITSDRILVYTPDAPQDLQRPSWVTLDTNNKDLSQWSPVLGQDLGLNRWTCQPLVDLVRKWHDWDRYKHVPYMEATRILAHLTKDSEEGTFRHGTPGPWLSTACHRASQTLQYDWHLWNGPRARPSWNSDKGNEKGKGKGLEKGKGKGDGKGIGKGGAVRGIR